MKLQKTHLVRHTLLSAILLFALIYFLTASAAAPAQPTMNAVQCNSSGTVASLSWGTASGAQTYPVRYSAPNLGSCPAGWFSPVPGECALDGSSATSVSIPTTPGIAYKWWVHALGAGGWSGYTQVSFSCAAATTALAQPTMAPVQCNANGTSATLSWGPVVGSNFYSVRYKGTAISSCPAGWYMGAPSECDIEDSTATSLTVPISPGKSYQWWIHAKYPGTWNGASPYTQVTFSCPTSAVPAQPTMNAAQCSSSGTSATLSWSTVSGAQSYPVRFSASGLASCPLGWSNPSPGECALDGSSATSVSIPTTPGIAYKWWVHALGAGGWSGFTQAPFTCVAPGGGSPSLSAGLPSAWGLGNWTPIASRITITPNVTNDIVTSTEDTTTGSHGIEQYIDVPASNAWQISFEIATGTRGVRVYLFDADDQSNTYVATQCDPSGVGRILSKWGSPNATSEAQIISLSSAWKRCILRGTFPSTRTASKLRLVIYAELSGQSSYKGDGTTGLRLSNFRLTGNFAGGTLAKADASHNLVTSLFPQKEGFGANTTGGLNGDIYTVTNLNDSGAGSLRFAAEDRTGKAYWIIFSPSLSGGTLNLNTPIYVGSNKTIDGRGSAITIARHGLSIASPNVIVNNIAVRNLVDPNEDNISIYGTAAKNVWIHRTSLSGQGGDGLLDVTDGATDITIDWSRFTDHDKVMIVNSYATSPHPTNPNSEVLNGHELDNYVRDSNVRITMHHNAFIGTTQRHPRSVFAKIHMYNNLLLNWGSFGVGSSFRTQTLAEGNVFNSSGQYANQALITRVGIDPEPGFIRAVNNLFVGTASGASSGPSSVFVPSYTYRCERATATLASTLQQRAGVEGSDTTSPVSLGSGCPAL